MPRSRHVVLTQAAAAASDDGPPSLGSLSEVRGALARYNTSPDGAPAGERDGTLGTTVMHGPGMVMEMAEIDGEIRQIMVTMTDDDFCFPVLVRLCRERRWTMLDPETGRKFGP